MIMPSSRLKYRPGKIIRKIFLILMALPSNPFVVRTILNVIILLIPMGLCAQEPDLEKLRNDRAEIVRKIDSLQNVLDHIDRQLIQADPAQREQAMTEKYGKNKGKLISAGRVWTSISTEMARDAWGAPLEVQKTEIQGGHTEKWIYPEGRYLFFKNGKLESWRE